MKNWCLMIYANGNNELEPEMCNSLLNAERVGSGKTVDVVMQLARYRRDHVEIIRPNENFPDYDNNWTGVRRYHVTKAKRAEARSCLHHIW